MGHSRGQYNEFSHGIFLEDVRQVFCQKLIANTKLNENLQDLQCLEGASRSRALKHGLLAKSKWVFKVKCNSGNTDQPF
jgi:hypothetical protein